MSTEESQYFKNYDDLEEFHIFKSKNKRGAFRSINPKE
jgi:hypothetical protein